jgi:hypothetical protein
MLLQLIVLIVVLGVALYLVETYVPMAPPLKLLLRVVIVLAIIIYLFRLAGLLPL